MLQTIPAFSFLILLLIAPRIIRAQPLTNDVPGLFIDRVSLSSVGATNYYYNNSMVVTTQISNVVAYNYTWRMPLSQTISSGLSVHNYVMGSGDYFSYQVELMNVSCIGADISLQSFGNGNWIYYMTFNVIIVTIDSLSLELMSYTSSFIVLSKSNRAFPCRLTNWLGISYMGWCFAGSDTFNVPSSKYNFLYQSQYSLGCFLQWVRFNLTPAIGTQDFKVSCNIVNGSSFVAVTVSSNGYYYNSLNSFKVNVLVINCNSYSPNVAYWNSSFDTWTAFPANLNTPAIFNNPLSEYRCIYGYSGVSRYMTVSLFKFSQSGGNMSSVTNSLDYHSVFVYCVVSCPQNRFVDYNNHTQNCQMCDNYLSYCGRCTSKQVCVKCSAVAALRLNHKCSLCRDFVYLCRYCFNVNESLVNCSACYVGKLVEGGCTTVVGCTKVVQIFFPVHYSICADCDAAEFNYNMINHTCDCKVGWLVGYFCTTIDGCSATVKVNGTVECIRCSEVNHFQLKGVECFCKQYYQLINHICVQVCGDGVRITLPCDDGNLIDGDGCDSTCNVQPYYQCTKFPTLPALCKFYGRNINITLVQARKVQSQNQAVFKIAFQPKLLRLAELQIQNLFTFTSASSRFSVNDWQFNDGYLFITVDYLSNLEGKQASVHFTFDNYYIHHSPIQLNFTIKGNGNQILYFQYTAQQQIMSMTMFAISIIAVSILVFGSWSQKLIGAEFIYSLQIIYYAHFGVDNYRSNLTPFQFLGLVGLNKKSITYSLVNFRFDKKYQILAFFPDIIQIDFLIVVPLIVFIIACAIVIKVVVKKTKARKIKILKLIEQNNTIYTNLVFPFLISITLPLFIACSTMFFRRKSIQKANIPHILLCILSFVLICIHSINFSLSFFRTSFKKSDLDIDFQIQDMNNKRYLFIFQLLLLLSFFGLQFWLAMGLPFCLQTLIGLNTLFLIWQLAKRPYNNFIDNLSINCNIFIAWSFLIVVFLCNQNIIPIEDGIANIVAKCYTICLGLASMLSVLRMVKVTIRTVKGLKQAKIRVQRLQVGPSRNYEVGQSKQEIRLGLLKNRIVQENNLKNKENQPKLQLDIESQNQEAVERNLDQQFSKQLKNHKKQFSKRRMNRMLSERQIDT